MSKAYATPRLLGEATDRGQFEGSEKAAVHLQYLVKAERHQ